MHPAKPKAYHPNLLVSWAMPSPPPRPHVQAQGEGNAEGAGEAKGGRKRQREACGADASSRTASSSVSAEQDREPDNTDGTVMGTAEVVPRTNRRDRHAVARLRLTNRPKMRPTRRCLEQCNRDPTWNHWCARPCKRALGHDGAHNCMKHGLPKKPPPPRPATVLQRGVAVLPVPVGTRAGRSMFIFMHQDELQQQDRAREEADECTSSSQGYDSELARTEDEDAY